MLSELTCEVYGDLAADVHDDPLPGDLGELVRVVDVQLPAVVVVVGHEVSPVRSFLVQPHWNMEYGTLKQKDGNILCFTDLQFSLFY